jgi:hypothetical protein
MKYPAYNVVIVKKKGNTETTTTIPIIHEDLTIVSHSLGVFQDSVHRIDFEFDSFQKAEDFFKELANLVKEARP